MALSNSPSSTVISLVIVLPITIIDAHIFEGRRLLGGPSTQRGVSLIKRIDCRASAPDYYLKAIFFLSHDYVLALIKTVKQMNHRFLQSILWAVTYSGR